ncbi:ABC transporter ATP-binding protein [Dyella nitratireducens]|uniref:ABC transporter ATP-binding protein n=2 Tax=Dyella nitratireducens TaxID=1849580 RepID=A0ABQ1GBY1_9GAMM|nr:ABC transporter ATP-binding protein [Dyella nitratireducens]GLQ40600.1 ABC transporter ATP-binding protein [Dyella nitratireducens]
MRHASTLDLSSFENPKVQDQLDRARKQIAARTPLLAQSLSQIQSSLTLFAYATGVALYAPKLIVIIVLGWIPAALCGMHFNTVSYIEEKNKLPQRRYLDYLRNLVASSAPAKEIKGYRLADYFIEQYASLSNALHKQETHFVLRRTLVTSLLSCLGAIAQLCAYLYLIVAVMGGGLSIGGFAFLVMSLLRITNLMQSSTTGLTQLASQALYLDDLYDFLSEKSRMTEALSPRPFPQRMQSGVEFRNVSFEYTGAHTHAINDISFTLRPGEVIAFVGENGAGKSTIVKLLSRMYDATSGSILIDGADISDYSTDDIRSNIVTTHQDFIRYQLRAIDNVRFGDILDGANEERIHRSIDYASAAALIAKLKGGLRQIVGHLFEGGVGLSGGEWQKLAIARSYMGRAQIYIFDEPTASLDAKSEQATFSRIKELARGASAVIISHRFSTVRMADRIYVMDGGKIIQAGTHEQLMATPGSYSDLFTLQAAGYR